MITKISPQRSGHPGRLVNYLFGPGNANEHLNPRTVAGSVHYEGAGPEIRGQVIADLHLPTVLWPKTEFPGGQIYHVALSIGANEGQLPDHKWERIAHEYMQGMGLEAPGKAPIRWTAVHHGLSSEGNDHIHLVVNLVREDGTKASIWQDRVKAQKVVAAIEQRHGLQVLQSRLTPVGAGSVPYTQTEVALARTAGRPVDRVTLERHVRAASTAAASEADFVRSLRDLGVQVRPFPQHTGTVTGYSVALLQPDGTPGTYFGGGSLARDLTLPRLRRLWPDAGGSAGQALEQWRPTGAPVPTAGIQLGEADLEVAAQQLHAVEVDLHLAKPEEFAKLSQDVAGAVAAAAHVAPPEQRVELAAMAREVGGWAGTTQPVKRLQPSRMQIVALALLHALNPDSELSRAFMRRQLITGIFNVVRAHRLARPTAVTNGRGSLMSAPTDDIDGVLSDALTTTAVTVMAAYSTAEQSRRARQAAALAAPRGRFSLHRGESPLTPRDPVPAGLRETLPKRTWDELSPTHRRQLDPDRVGYWPTDISLDRPETGPQLPATATQIQLAGRMGDALGMSGQGAEVATLTRGAAGEALRRMEQQLPAAKLEEIYHYVGMPHRHSANGGVGYLFPDGTAITPDPGPSLRTRTATAEQGGNVRTQERTKDPLQWASAGDPVTADQRHRLGTYGVASGEIDRLNKGWASVVITTYDEQGPKAGDAAVDRALAAVENLSPSANGPKAQDPTIKNRPRHRP